MPDGIAPRLANRAALRRRLGGMTWRQVEALIERGQLPRPLWNVEPDDARALWDLRAVDRALDQASGLPANLADATHDLDRALGFGR